MRCAACGFEGPDGARFCAGCGVPLASTTNVPSPTRSVITLDTAAERRPLTVMFVDLVGSTSLSEQLDPEELRDVVAAYQSVCLRAIQRFDGHIAQYLGDGLLVYFGYPTAHEDDARRAILAAREIVADVPRLSAQSWEAGTIALAVRIGIHTGLTVVGDVGTGDQRERLAMGEAPNVAARLQGLAAANEIVISEVTQKLVERHFACEPLGAQTLRGLSRVVHAYRVLEAMDDRSAGVSFGVTPLVGRRKELAEILRRFDLTATDGTQTVIVEGDAGIGKSRLIQAVRDGVQTRTHVWLSTACSSFYQNSFLSPIRALIESIAGVESTSSVEQRTRRLELAMRRVGCPVEQTMPFLLPLLIGEHEGAGAPSELSAQVRKQRTLEAVAMVIRALAARHPVILVIEDVHWADPSTLELLDVLTAREHTTRLLALFTSRTQLSAPWSERPHVGRLPLTALGRSHVTEMLRLVCGGRALPAELMDGILDRADGVPIFAEELVKNLLESGVLREREGYFELVSPIDAVTIPMTLQSSLLARLDPLGRSKDLAQVASVLGRRFRVELLGSIAPMEADEFAVELNRLESAGVLQRATSGTQTEVEFRHALLQEAAYDSLLRTTRRRLHEQIAVTLEKTYTDVVDGSPEVLGLHWSRSGQHANAVPYLSRAAQRATRAWANAEAVAFSRQALDEIRALRGVNASANPTTSTNANANGASDWRRIERELYEQLGDLLALMDRRDESEEAYLAAIGRCDADDVLTLARLHRAIGMVRQQDPERGWTGFARAEQALGLESAERPVEWRREWISIQLGKLWMHYWFDRPDEMTALVARIEPVIDGAATDVQRAGFFDLLTLTDCRRERFALSAETVSHAQQYSAAADATGVLSEIASARMTLGFAQLHHGRVREAVDTLENALTLSRRSGHRSIEIRCLTYLITAHRLNGDAVLGSRHMDAAFQAARAEGRPEYVGMLHGHRAWLALLNNDHGAAAAESLEALRTWDESEMDYPFQWAALLPLFAVRVSEGDLDGAASCATRLLAAHQQRLPGALEDALRGIVDAHASGDVQQATAAARAVLVAAQESGLLPVTGTDGAGR